MVINKREDVTKQGFCKILWRKLRTSGKSLISTYLKFFRVGGTRKGVGAYLSLRGGRWGGGGRSFEAGRLLHFSALRMGAYSRWALIWGWVLIRINTVSTQKKNAHRPDIKTDRLKNVFVNRIIFRRNLWSFYYLYTVCLTYFYLFICIHYVLCIFRFSTADVT